MWRLTSVDNQVADHLQLAAKSTIPFNVDLLVRFILVVGNTASRQLTEHY
jgi:hypothetical protein